MKTQYTQRWLGEKAFSKATREEVARLLIGNRSTGNTVKRLNTGFTITGKGSWSDVVLVIEKDTNN